MGCREYQSRPIAPFTLFAHVSFPVSKTANLRDQAGALHLLAQKRRILGTKRLKYTIQVQLILAPPGNMSLYNACEFQPVGMRRPGCRTTEETELLFGF